MTMKFNVTSATLGSTSNAFKINLSTHGYLQQYVYAWYRIKCFEDFD